MKMENMTMTGKNSSLVYISLLNFCTIPLFLTGYHYQEMEEQVTEVEQDVILQNNELLLHFSIHHKGLLALKNEN